MRTSSREHAAWCAWKGRVHRMTAAQTPMSRKRGARSRSTAAGASCGTGNVNRSAAFARPLRRKFEEATAQALEDAIGLTFAPTLVMLGSLVLDVVVGASLDLSTEWFFYAKFLASGCRSGPQLHKEKLQPLALYDRLRFSRASGRRRRRLPPYKRRMLMPGLLRGENQPLNRHQITADYDLACEILAHILDPHRVCDGSVVGRHEVSEHQRLDVGLGRDMS